jgi:DNA (cytosine-5)-methyltransferase 1
MARAALVLQPKAIMIENVVGALRSRSSVVQQVLEALKFQGFSVDCDFLDFLSVGVPQRRRRVIVVGSRRPFPKIAEIQHKFLRPRRSLEWAIRDLEHDGGSSFFDSPARPNATTQERIHYLFDHNLYELPNALRPACHRDKKHSYDTVYGRLRWELPSQTITRGFYCMCMGRYVHPSCRRTLTAHEAARIQFFPDYFDFGPCSSRTKAANLIGNAVPPKGAYVVGLELISSLSST